MENLSTKTDIHLARKVVHAMTGLSLALILKYIDNTAIKNIFYFIALLGVITDLSRFYCHKFNAILLKKFRLLARAEEEKSLSGMTAYFLGASLALIFSTTSQTAILLLIVAIADPMASLMGIKFGTIKLYQHKSWMGLVTYFIFAAVIFTLNADFAMIEVLTLALTLALVESFMPLNDNISVPLVGSLLLSSFSH